MGSGCPRVSRCWVGTAAAVALLGVPLNCARAGEQSYPARVAVHFSPGGGCTDAIVREIRGARREVLVQAFSLTSAPIAGALRDAFRRGVKVTALLDDSNQSDRYTAATFLANAKIPTYVDAAHAIAHNKIMVIDGGTVITGSFNFTKAAQNSNAENVLIIKDSPGLVRAYQENFRAHLRHAARFRRGAGSRWPSLRRKR